MSPVTFVDEWGCTHTMTVEQAAEKLRLYENEWPGGLDEIESCWKHWRKAYLGEKERGDKWMADCKKAETDLAFYKAEYDRLKPLEGK